MADGVSVVRWAAGRLPRGATYAHARVKELWDHLVPGRFNTCSMSASMARHSAGGSRRLPRTVSENVTVTRDLCQERGSVPKRQFRWVC